MVTENLGKTKAVEEYELGPWKLFLNAMRSPMTRDRYSTRVAKFFDFIKIPGKTPEQKARTFAKKGKNDTNWALSSILKFVYFQRERVEKQSLLSLSTNPSPSSSNALKQSSKAVVSSSSNCPLILTGVEITDLQ